MGGSQSTNNPRTTHEQSTDNPDGKTTEEIINEEEVLPTHNIVSLEEIDLADIELSVCDESMEIAEYCLTMLVVDFQGQTSCFTGGDDVADTQDVLNLGLYLSLMDKFIRCSDNVADFTGEEDEYHLLLRLVAMKRFKKGEETYQQCLKRLEADNKRFIQIYHKRGVKSEILEREEYWGSRQQLLAAKCIADWVDKDNGPLDPLFGVLLQPTAGRVGPGDSGWFHKAVFDDRGHMAYHSAVHDGFGYLKTSHDVGPGYSYVRSTIILSASNPLAGQFSGMSFWKQAIEDIETKQKVLKCWRY